MALDTELSVALKTVEIAVKGEVNKVVSDAKDELKKSIGSTFHMSVLHMTLGGVVAYLVTHFLHL